MAPLVGHSGWAQIGSADTAYTAHEVVARARFADRLAAERLAEREIETEARLRAARLRVTDIFEPTEPNALRAPTDPERTRDAADRSGLPGAATLGEIPPARDDGRDGAKGDACAHPCPPRERGGIRPTPAGALGLWLDRIG